MLTPRPDEAPRPPPAGTMPLGTFTGSLLLVLVIAALAGAFGNWRVHREDGTPPEQSG